MTQPRPPSERPTAQELAGGAHQSMQIAGKPADICPRCGAAMFAYRTNTLDTRIIRYVECRNPKCGKKFVSRQPTPPPAVLVREVGSDEDSSPGNQRLTLVRESA